MFYENLNVQQLITNHHPESIYRRYLLWPFIFYLFILVWLNGVSVNNIYVLKHYNLHGNV